MYKIVSLNTVGDVKIDLAGPMAPADRLEHILSELQQKMAGSSYAKMAIEGETDPGTLHDQFNAFLREHSGDLANLESVLKAVLSEVGISLPELPITIPDRVRIDSAVRSDTTQSGLAEPLLGTGQQASPKLSGKQIASSAVTVLHVVPNLSFGAVILLGALLRNIVTGQEKVVGSFREFKDLVIAAGVSKPGHNPAARALNEGTILGYNIVLGLLGVWATVGSSMIDAEAACKQRASDACGGIPINDDDTTWTNFVDCEHNYALSHPDCISPNRFILVAKAFLITMPILMGLGVTYVANKMSKIKSPASPEDAINIYFGEGSAIAKGFAVYMATPKSNLQTKLEKLKLFGESLVGLAELPSRAAEKLESKAKILPATETLFDDPFLVQCKDDETREKAAQANLIYRRLCRQRTPSDSSVRNLGAAAAHLGMDFLPITIKPINGFRSQFETLIDLCIELDFLKLVTIMADFTQLMVEGDAYLAKIAADTLSARIVKNMAAVGESGGAKDAFKAFLRGADPSEVDDANLTEDEFKKLMVSVLALALNALKNAEALITLSQTAETPNPSVSLPRFKQAAIDTAIQIVTRNHSVVGIFGQFVFNIRTLGGIINFFATDYATAAVQEKYPNFPSWLLNLVVLSLSRQQ